MSIEARPDAGDPFDLERFVEAQKTAHDRALAELRKGRKTGHWIWFVFPQMRGLGRSGMAWDFGITSLEEARAYLAHPVLGPRLVEVTRLVLTHRSKSVSAIFGAPDDLKFRSSMTLFAAAAPAASPFQQAIDQKCGGERCRLTLALLA